MKSIAPVDLDGKKNLLLNAFDAMADNPLADQNMTIGAALESPTTIRVAVRDQGTELAPGQIAQLFHSFYTTKSKGLGIELLVSRSIIESHGGRVWAENNNGDRGAAFLPFPSWTAATKNLALFLLPKKGGN